MHEDDRQTESAPSSLSGPAPFPQFRATTRAPPTKSWRPALFISLPLVVAISVFVIVSIWNNIYAMFINGIGEIKIQLYTAVIAMFLNIPLAIFFVKYVGLGLSGIVLATIISLMLAAVALPIQVHYILRSGMRVVPA